MGEKVFVPSRLVFEIILRFSILNIDFLQRKGEVDALHSTQAKTNSTIAEKSVHEAPTRHILLAVDRIYILGEEVLVYSET